MVTVGEAGCLLGALCSILAPVWESCPRHGGKDTLLRSLTAARKPPSCERGTAGQLDSGCLQLGRGQEQVLLGPQPTGLGRGGQQVFTVVCCDGVGRRQVGRGRQGSLVAPAPLLSQEARQTPCSGPSAWESYGQSVIAAGWGLISLGKQPASGYRTF